MSLRKKNQAKKIPREHRAVPLAVGELTAAKQSALATLRTEFLRYQQIIAQLLWIPEPLVKARTQVEMYELSRAFLKQESGFNKAYLQCAEQAVIVAANEQQKRYFSQLIGRLRNVASEIPSATRKERKFFYVPEAVQDTITAAELMALAQLPEQLDFTALRTLLREVVIEGQPLALSPAQIAVLCEIHAQVQQRYRPLTFKDDDFTSVSIALDYRMLPSEDKDLTDQLSGQVQLLLDKKNSHYKFFLSIASPVPRTERIHLPVAIKHHLVERLLKEDKAAVNSLTLVLGKDRASVRMVIAKPKAKPEPKLKMFVARDFGYVNTISLSVIQADREIDIAEMERIQLFTKAQTRKHLETHAHPEGQSLVIERIRFSGRKFLDAIKRKCSQIDEIRSWIDVAYNKVEHLKIEIVRDLQLPADSLLANDGSHPKLRKFFQLLNKINGWKAKRRVVYGKIAALKRNWFGFLSNQELALAQKHDATIVREHLTNEAIEVDDPKYKGRTFNKMINNGARGQYERMASNKFLWYGVPEFALPSFYTSQTCTVHASVNESQRDGEVFKCAVGGERHHADEHAGDTIGLYLLLRPITTVTPTFRTVGSSRL
ncbi:MAG: transposase [Acidobacteria bacterium]|nr:transposase [Acidobacteriota bacterium]